MVELHRDAGIDLLNLDARALDSNEKWVEQQKAFLFGSKEYSYYAFTKHRGRRGNVVSLQSDQLSSLVKIVEQEEVYCRFRFYPNKPQST